MKSLKIFSPVPNKGLHRKYVSSDQVKNESNYIELGLIIYDENEEIIKDAIVEIKATDDAQNKILNGTGNATWLWNEKEQKKVLTYYYNFHYEFKIAGKHKIKFTARNKGNPNINKTLNESIELEAE